LGKKLSKKLKKKAAQAQLDNKAADNANDNIEAELKSKSEVKREMYQLQDFAQSLVNMSKHQRSKLPLTEELLDAMIVANKIANKHEALRRHIRHIAKILLETDLAPIKQALDVMANKHQQESSKHVKLEKIHADLITQGNAVIETLLAEYAQMERQKLRQLVRQATKEHQAEKPAKYSKELFQYLKSHIKF
jgi:ribosome-associated protein